MAPPPPRPAGASQLLRGGPPAHPATVLTASRFSRSAGSLSPSTTHANGSVETRLPTFRAKAADRTHVAYMPDTTWPVSGHPPGSSRAFLLRPGFDATLLSNDTSTAIPENEDCAPSSRSPPDASRAPFPHRSPRRSSANAACGGLQPPTAGRLRRANLHLLHSTMSKSSTYKQNFSPRSWHT